MLRILALFVFIFLFTQLLAQKQDTIHLLSGVEIQENRLSTFAAGLKIDKYDSATIELRQSSNIANLLSEQSASFLRSYSPGGIATLSVRGTNSSQAAVFWNGININQPNMGMTDVSRISVFEFNSISLQSGGSSALLGSGTIGGGLMLENTLTYSLPIKISAMIAVGNPSKLSGAVKMQFGKQFLAYSGSFSASYDENNFFYTDFYKKRIRLDHAKVKSLSSLHQFEYKIDSKQKLSAGFWYQSTDRQIPPTMTMTFSDQQQKDEVIRTTLQWTYTGTRKSWIVRSAFIDEKEHYESPVALVNAKYHLTTIFTELENKTLLTKYFSMGYGASFHNIKANVDYYKGIKFQQEGAMWLAFAFAHYNKGIKSILNLRQDFSEGYRVPFCPALSGEFPIVKKISGTYSFSRNFRIPTLNDKFWIPGGNPDLKPESSWNNEIGFNWEIINASSFKAKIKIDLYHMKINDLIQWVSGSNGIWSPQNVSKVLSRGVEVVSKMDFKNSIFAYFFTLGYNYSPSTVKMTTIDANILANKQLIYIPLHKVTASAKLCKGLYYISANSRFTSKRYTVSDNSQSLPFNMVTDFYTGTSYKMQRVNLKFQFEIRNLLNEQFQSILYYPEPGRTYNLNIIITN